MLGSIRDSWIFAKPATACEDLMLMALSDNYVAETDGRSLLGHVVS